MCNFTTQINITAMKNVDDYRQQIMQCLAAAVTEAGTPRFTDKQVRELSEELSDQELIDGMDFNTPEEVAQLLMESGLES